MTFNNENTENQEINFNLFTNNNLDNSKNNRHEYIYEDYKIVTNIINNKMIITIQNKFGKIYEKCYSQEELIEINNIFSMYDKVEDSINIIEMNNKNFCISIIDNICIFSIKLDIKELPKKKISDSIIFKIPVEEHSELKNAVIINNNKSSNYTNELMINSNDENGLNLNDIGPIIQKLISKIDYLTEENNEIKKRLNVLEKNNNELINIIKENRINILKEKNNLDSSSTIISNNNKGLENENNQNNNLDINNAFSLFLSQENEKLNDLENEDSPNFLTRIHTKFLKEKIKNKKDIKEEGFKEKKDVISNKEEKANIKYFISQKSKDINNKKEEDEEDNYLFTNKNENEIFDDINLFQNKWDHKTQENFKSNKNFGENIGINKNIISVDENEEENKEKFNKFDLKNDKYEDWTINNSNNIVGFACLPNSKNSSFSFQNNKKDIKNNQNNYYSKQIKKGDFNIGNESLF